MKHLIVKCGTNLDLVVKDALLDPYGVEAVTKELCLEIDGGLWDCDPNDDNAGVDGLIDFVYRIINPVCQRETLSKNLSCCMKLCESLLSIFQRRYRMNILEERFATWLGFIQYIVWATFMQLS